MRYSRVLQAVMLASCSTSVRARRLVLRRLVHVLSSPDQYRDLPLLSHTVAAVEASVQ